MLKGSQNFDMKSDSKAFSQYIIFFYENLNFVTSNFTVLYLNLLIFKNDLISIYYHRNKYGKSFRRVPVVKIILN